MTESTSESEAVWREVLVNGHHSRLSVLPGSPRCAGCAIPMSGIGGSIMKVMGRHVSRKSPNLCNVCEDVLPDGGAEIDIAVLFADMRNSTALGESMGSAAFASLLNRFYKIGTDILLEHKAVIDKMIGDEVMALFFPANAGSEYRRNAVLAAADMTRAFREKSADDMPMGVGIGVHAGLAYVGKVGTSGITDFTAVGDTVNIAARLQAEAGPGELVMSDEIYQAAAGALPDLEEQTITVKGREEPVTIRVLRETT